MSDVFDGFGDVLEGTAGIFGKSEGLEAFDSVQHQYGPEGMVVQIHCESCGKPRHMTVMWPEICAVKFNVSPQEAYAQHPTMRQYAVVQWMSTAGAVHRGVPYAWYPQVRCRCGNTIQRPLIQPSECDQHLAEARRNRWLPQNAEMAFSQQARAVAQHLGRL
jgi:hypothetical protein